MIKRSCVEKIKDASIIEDVIGQFVVLKKAGVSYKGLSPFQNEKSPSFTVHPAKNIWKCFSSGKSGYGAWSFLMEKEIMPFNTAMEWLAKRYNIEVEQEEDLRSPEQKEQDKTKAETADGIIQLARGVYSDHRTEQKEWFEKRGLTEDDIDKWGLGFAPDSWEALTKKIITGFKIGYSVAEEIGLVKAKEERTYDVLRGRITFPIHDNAGRCIGFAGRDITGATSVAKYINPKESFLYKKEHVLYGMDFARTHIVKADRVILVEGYLDVIAMHRAGFENTVGTCGTAITESHLKRIAKMCGTVTYVVEDAQAVKGIKKAIEQSMILGLEVTVVVMMQDGKKRDPDEMVLELGKAFAAEFNELEQNGVKWLFDQMTYKMVGAKAKQKVVDDILEIISMVPEDFDQMIESYCELAALSFQDSAFSQVEEDEIGNLNTELAAAKSIEDTTKQEKKVVSIRIKMDALKKRQTKRRDDYSPDSEYFKKNIKSYRDKREKQKKTTLKKLNDISTASIEEPIEFGRTDSELMDTLAESNALPEWVKKRFAEFRRESMLQLEEPVERYPLGMYFPAVTNNMPNYSMCYRISNFVILPMYHILDLVESHRMVLFINDLGERYYADLTDTQLAGLDSFKKLLNRLGAFGLEPSFGSFHFAKLTMFIKRRTTRCIELKYLGWQSKDFFAFNNILALHSESGMALSQFNQQGVAEIDGQTYISPSLSPSKLDEVGGNSTYEDEKYLQFKESPITLDQWMKLFHDVYGDHGKIGIGFVLITCFRDLIFKQSLKCPLLYLHGEAQSGKTQMAESISHLFFAGKNSMGLMRPSIPMSGGMVSPFALADAMQMFQNCPTVYNEWDMKLTDELYYGWIKNSYDGEGRRKGNVSSGKARSETQHVRGTSILVGQYPDTRDDGALLTRTIQRKFMVKDVVKKSEESVARYVELKELEKKGLSSLVIDIMSLRGEVDKFLREEWNRWRTQLIEETARRQVHIEHRVMESYALVMSLFTICDRKLNCLPFSMNEVLDTCVADLITGSALKSRFSILNSFWAVVEELNIKHIVQHGIHYDIKIANDVTIRLADDKKDIQWVNTGKDELLFLHLNSVIGEYQKEMRIRGERGYEKSSVMDYMRNTNYLIGICPNHYYSQGRQTSAWVFNYTMMKAADITISSSGPAKPQARRDEPQPLLAEAGLEPGRREDSEEPF